MAYVIIVKDNIEFIFFFSCNEKGSNSCNFQILGEILKLRNFCYVKGYPFDYIVLDHLNYDVQNDIKTGNLIIHKYNNNLNIVLEILKSRLAPLEQCELCLINEGSFYMLENMSESEILSMLKKDLETSEVFNKLYKL